MSFERIESLNPSICISGKVMRLSRVTANIFRKYLHPFEITDSQLTILFILSKREGLSQKQLADIAILEKSTLNRNLQRLFEKGYLTRVDFPMIRITEKGKHFLNEIIPEWEKAMSEIKILLGKNGEEALDLVHFKLLKNKKS